MTMRRRKWFDYQSSVKIVAFLPVASEENSVTFVRCLEKMGLGYDIN